MGAVILEPRERRWACPSCPQKHVTRIALPHTPVHACAGVRGVSVPFVEVQGDDLAKHSVRHVLKEREDYVGDEWVQRDPELGRPILSVSTERADGSNDVRVFAPTAVLRIG